MSIVSEHLVYGKQLQAFLEPNPKPNLDGSPAEAKDKLNISDEEVVLVQVAALCHDLGHGPLSHCWEDVMKAIIKADNSETKYSHEDMSCSIFEHMVTNYPDIKNSLALLKGKIPDFAHIDEVTLIQDMIKGVKPEDLAKKENDSKAELYRKKYFLFQIVSNEYSKIDVDKFDYMLRDSKFLNLNVTLDYKRIIHNTGIEIHEIGGKAYNVLIYRRKISHTLEELFSDRMIMHRKAYQHPKNVLLQQMFVDGFKLAKDHFELYSGKGKYFLKDFIDKAKESRIDAFLEATDNLVDLIKQEYYRQIVGVEEKYKINELDKKAEVERKEKEKKKALDELKLKPAVALFDRIEDGNRYTLIGYFLLTKKKNQEELMNIIENTKIEVSKLKNKEKKAIDEQKKTQELIKEEMAEVEEMRKETISNVLEKIRVKGTNMEMTQKRTIAGFGTETYHPLKRVKFFHYEHENDKRSIKFTNPPDYPDIPPNEIKYLVYVKEKLEDEEVSVMRKQLIEASENEEFKQNGLLFVPE